MAVIGIITESDIQGGHVKWTSIMYAFSESLLEVSVSDGSGTVTARFPTGGRDASGDFDEWYTETRTPDANGKAWFNASPYIRAYFGGVEKMPLPDMTGAVGNTLYDGDWTFEVQVGGNTAFRAERDVTAAWASFGFEDTYTGERHLLWNVNLPMTVDVFATKISAAADYGTSKDMNLGSGPGWFPAWRVPVRSLVAAVPDLLVEAVAGNAFRYRNGVVEDGQTQDILFVCDFRKPEDGVYLRWLDRFGRMCYRMFTKGREALEVKHDNSYVRISEDYFRNNPALIGTQSFGDRVYADVAAVRTLTIGDEWVDRFELAEVLGLAQSMFVEMFADDVWYRVNVVPASFSYDMKDELNRFSVTVQVPVTGAQWI